MGDRERKAERLTAIMRDSKESVELFLLLLLLPLPPSPPPAQFPLEEKEVEEEEEVSDHGASFRFFAEAGYAGTPTSNRKYIYSC